MIVLGIDPGSRRTGWGLIDHQGQASRHLASGTFRLGAERPLAERLCVLAEALDAVLERHRPEACAVEQIFTARNARSALVLGHARGVVLYGVARRGIAVHEYSASRVKQTVVGMGRANKTQVQQMVKVLLGYRGALAEDEADALALALTHGAASRWGSLP